MAQDLTFTTTVSGHTDHGLELRGVSLDKLIDQADFVATLFLAITGHTPTAGQNKLLNAILVASIDHGIEPASGFVPRVVAASGNSMLTAMASTLLALGPYHGGAVTAAMEVFTQFQVSTTNLEADCLAVVLEHKKNHQRLPGFGHPIYTDLDPRAQQLLLIAQRAKINPFYANVAQTLEQVLETTLKRKLVLNVDGAVGALLIAMGFLPQAGNGIFALARVGGSIAHIIEEQQNWQSVRRVPHESITYSPPQDE